MEPALPMPPVEELDVMFSELVVSPRFPSQIPILSFPSLGAGRERREGAWLVWLALGLPCFCEMTPILSLTSASELSALTLWKRGRRKKVALLHQRALLVLSVE